MIIQKAKKNMFSIVSCLIFVFLVTLCAKVETASAIYKIRIYGDVSNECTTKETSMTRQATREAVDCFIDRFYSTPPYIPVGCESGGTSSYDWFYCYLESNQVFPGEVFVIDNGIWYGGVMFGGDLRGNWDILNYGSCGQ